MLNVGWLFFDLGNTLIDERHAHRLRIENTMKNLRAAGFYASFEDIYESIIAASKRYEPPFSSAIKKYGEAFKAPYPKELERLYPQTKPLLAALHGKYKIGVIANQSPGTEERLERFGISDYIDIAITSAEVGLSKPDEKIYKLALKQGGGVAEKSAMIGDRLDNDICPAKKLGMKTIWIKQGFGGMQEPVSGDYRPDFTVDSLDGLRKILL